MAEHDERFYEQVVDAINDIYGRHGGARAAHAKGTLCAGTFTATPQASELTRAAHMQGDPVRVHVRFSNGSGDPASNDTAPDGRGMATKFYLPDSTTTDIVGISLRVFFVRTPEDFLAFTRARRPDPETGQPDMAKLGEYLAAHPEAGPAIQQSLAAEPPTSYTQVEYNGLHAFRFVNADGEATWIRYRLVPEAGEASLSDEELADRDPDYLQTELGERLARGPAAFTLLAQLASEMDPTDDPTAAWPEDGEFVELGRLEVTELAFDREQEGDVLVFDPTRVTDGIELSDDPILLARPQAYAESVLRRTGVARQPDPDG
jgi:catalase